MSKPRDLSPLPAHPAVSNTFKTIQQYGHTRPGAKVTCPKCRVERWYAHSILRHLLQRPTFTGTCRKCWLAEPWERAHRNKRNPSGKRIITSGYIAVGKNAVSDDELDMWFAMRTGSMVLEHRWVMAKHLGRALTSKECVDHMDGDKTNNVIDNLRLYVRGKQQPGSCPGHGTYYHEWQNALLEIKKLKSLLPQQQ